MRARNVTYADLDAFLDRLGLARRHIEVDHGLGAGGGNGVDGVAPARRPVPGYAYRRAGTGAVLVLPVRPADAAVAPRHLLAARRTLVDWDVITNEEFDRWLCQVRFPDVGAAPTGAGVDQARATG